MITERLIIREYQDTDFGEYFRLKSDNETMYYLQDIQLHSQREALNRVLQYVFSENDVYRVTTGCLAENIGSEIKCGLIKEAEHLDWEWHDGRMKNRLEYRLLKSEWERQR